MTLAFRIVASDVTKEIVAAFTGKKDAPKDTFTGAITFAATGAIREAGDLVKSRGRANIAAAGFSSKWQKTWRVNIYPKHGVSMDAAVWAFHKIPYSIAFEEGAHIRPKHGKLWIPLSSTPKVGRSRATPRLLSQSGVKLVTIKRPGKNPILATSVRLSRSQTAQSSLKLSLNKIRKGTAGKRGVVRAVPLFVGLDSVTIRKRFDLAGVANTVRGELGALYVKHLAET